MQRTTRHLCPATDPPLYPPAPSRTASPAPSDEHDTSTLASSADCFSGPDSTQASFTGSAGSGGDAAEEAIAEVVFDALVGPDPEARAALDALRPELHPRIADLVRLGLGHLSLARPSPTPSDGELQRVRLASVLRAELTGVTLVLDEPGSGLHARDLRALVAALEAWQAAGNTCVVVSHRPPLLRAAEWLVELGPGAGPAGGRLVAQGPADEVLAGETLTLYAFHLLVLYAGGVGLYRLVGHSLSLPAAIGAALGMLGLTCAVGLAWHRAKKRRRPARG